MASRVDNASRPSDESGAEPSSVDEELATCRLCLRQSKLCRSHIFPEFYFRRMYDDKGRFYSISSDTEQGTRYRQKGIYEKLLCTNCEQHINKFEIHAKRLFFDKMDYIELNGGGPIKVVNLDYHNFKLFQLSLLWRAGIAKDPFFAAVSLGPYHEERLRRMILDEKPGRPHEYGCAIIGLTMQEGQGFDAIIQPERGRSESHIHYRFTLGSCVWSYFVSSHTAMFPRKHYFLQEDGTLLLYAIQAKDAPFIRNQIDDLMAKGKFAKL